MRNFAILIFCFIAYITIQAQDLYFKHLGIPDGLSQVCIHTIFQDEFGAVWIGTSEGLNRYNGNNVLAFPLTNAEKKIFNSNIGRISGNRNGTLYIISEGDLLSINLYTQKVEKIRDKGVYNLFCEKDTLWITCTDGIYYYTQQEKKLSLFTQKPNKITNLGLKKVILPASLKKIGSQAFLGTHLEEVVFSAELQEIDDEAFTGVAELTSVTLSNNIQRIGYRAFSDCEQLSKVAYVGEMKTADCMVEIGAFQNCTSLTSFTFPQSLSEVQGWTFVGCRKLKEIILPKSVKKIGDQGLSTDSTVETITFEGEEVPELGRNSFPFEKNLIKIVVPSGKSEVYKAKWSSYTSYHSKIEEKS